MRNCCNIRSIKKLFEEKEQYYEELLQSTIKSTNDDNIGDFIYLNFFFIPLLFYFKDEPNKKIWFGIKPGKTKFNGDLFESFESETRALESLNKQFLLLSLPNDSLVIQKHVDDDIGVTEISKEGFVGGPCVVTCRKKYSY